MPAEIEPRSFFVHTLQRRTLSDNVVKFVHHHARGHDWRAATLILPMSILLNVSRVSGLGIIQTDHHLPRQTAVAVRVWCFRLRRGSENHESHFVSLFVVMPKSLKKGVSQEMPCPIPPTKIMNSRVVFVSEDPDSSLGSGRPKLPALHRIRNPPILHLA